VSVTSGTRPATLFRRRRESELPLVVGHRGVRGVGAPPENTLAAFESAVAAGAKAIELDVRTTKDGEVVVFHDERMGRMRPDAGDDRLLASVTLSELAKLTLDGGEAIPTLSRVLAWARERNVAVNVEMKRDVPSRQKLVRRVADIVAVHGTSVDVIVSSFDPWMLVELARISSPTPRALLTHRAGRASRLLHRVAHRSWLTAIHVERTEITPSKLARFHGAGLVVGVWTVNDLEEAGRFEAIGVDALITDRAGEFCRRFPGPAPRR